MKIFFMSGNNVRQATSADEARELMEEMYGRVAQGPGTHMPSSCTVEERVDHDGQPPLTIILTKGIDYHVIGGDTPESGSDPAP